MQPTTTTTTTTTATTTKTLADDFYKKVDHLSVEELDALPVGMIQLDAGGKVLSFNALESQLSGFSRARVIGKNFFTEVAPCTDVAAFRGRFEEGVKNQKLYERFRYRFAFKQAPRDVMITLFYSERNGTVWVTVQPQDAL